MRLTDLCKVVQPDDVPVEAHFLLSLPFLIVRQPQGFVYPLKEETLHEIGICNYGYL